MTAKEFRVGNHYYYHIVDELDNRKEWDEICIIEAADIEFLVENPDDKDFKPISLTDKILEKCGFKKGNICYENGYSIELLKTDFYLRPSYDGGFYWGFNLSKDKMDCELNDAKSIHYLHQLENLYFVLTAGKELEIKL